MASEAKGRAFDSRRARHIPNQCQPSLSAAALPTFSNVNTVVGSGVANAAIVPVDPDGTYCVYVSDPMHVIVDLMGTFGTSGLRFIAITPKRVHDSRASG